MFSPFNIYMAGQLKHKKSAVFHTVQRFANRDDMAELRL